MVGATLYAKSGSGAHIAYQVHGTGSQDLVLLPGIWSHIEHVWREPSFAHFLNRLARFSRLIMLDTRGSGLSDRASSLPLLEDQIDDVIAVLDAVGSHHPVLLGVSQSGPLAILLAAAHPGRISGLVLYGTYATALQVDDHPWGRSPEWVAEYVLKVDTEWGSGTDLAAVAPSLNEDNQFRTWWAGLERYSNPPGNAMAYISAHSKDDVRPVLPTISVPTLVLHRTHDPYRDIGAGRYLADRIPGAKLVELPGENHLPYVGHADDVLDEIEEFVTGSRSGRGSDRVLATVLFTDIVGSTEIASDLGDRVWRDVLGRHYTVVREELSRFRGDEVVTTGDGFLVRFDGPARAIKAAVAIRDRLARLGIQIRAGVHTGEIELIGDDIGGIAVHIGARVASLARAGEVLVSRTVKDLVTGAGIQFEDRGTHLLKGIPDPWQVYLVL